MDVPAEGALEAAPKENPPAGLAAAEAPPKLNPPGAGLDVELAGCDAGGWPKENPLEVLLLLPALLFALPKEKASRDREGE